MTAYGEQFEKVCPYYMAIGMSYDEFWNGAAELARYYREAHEIRGEMDNYASWMLGIYFNRAISNAIHGRKAKYPDEPFPLDTKISREKKARQQELNELKTVDYFNTWAENFNRNFAKRQKAEREKAREQADDEQIDAQANM